MSSITETCLRYLDGDLAEQEVLAFDELVANSPEVARELAKHLIDEHYFGKILATNVSGQIDSPDGSALNKAICHLDQQDEFEAVLQELLRIEQDARVLGPHELYTPDEEPHDSHGVAVRRNIVAGSSQSYRFARLVPAKWLAAAAVLLAATLAIVFIQNSEQTPVAKPVIATLTAEHGALWQVDPGVTPPSVGDEIHVGQRLTLTAGFAEITTGRGAIAILEAPCTVELFDNTNAIRLHSGRLVGICETPSSKGFLVRTPHMDITDLGTRFGVDATSPESVQTHVFEGEVEVEAPSADPAKPNRQKLAAGQAMKGSASDGFAVASYDPDRFDGIRLFSLRPNFAGTDAIWQGHFAGYQSSPDQDSTKSLQVFIERQSFELAQPLAVDFQRGAWRHEAEPGIVQITQGETVDVYLVILDLRRSNQRHEPEAAKEFALDFGRPILGVLTERKGLVDTDTTLGVAGVSYQGINHNQRGLDSDDTVSIDQDGTVLRLSLFGAYEGKELDQIRVIVQSAEDPHQP